MKWLLAGLLFLQLPLFAQINVELLHQLVAESKSEHSKQTKTRDRQGQVSAGEELNRSKVEKLKDRYRQLKNRFHTLGMAIDAGQIGIKAAPLVEEIVRHQTIIVEQAQKKPYLIPLAIETQEDLVNKSRSLAKYLIGLSVSFGDLNQMKQSDRNLLFRHVLTQLQRIAATSRELALNMTRSRPSSPDSPFSDFINQDKKLVNDIMEKVKILKK
ncbi:hypothetical protein [Desertivirga brevis]|uniref:hypothetical protein n=1 Tax=Desertivirga brevis TaxID=2810310 RepID=UPI001A958890|nr:hypothetical protein [Pedobacter sp. SYSU D00873]